MQVEAEAVPIMPPPVVLALKMLPLEELVD
jgi:hypothetical protein